jgi:2-methylcitrate dehydratase PrpD
VLKAVGATEKLASYVASVEVGQLPEPVVAETQRATLNYLGCAISGSNHPSIAIINNSLSDLYGPSHATLFGLRRQGPVLLAATSNATAACVDAFCDTHSEAIVHPCAAVMGAAFAVAERDHIAGDQFLLATALGLETSCRLSMAMSIEPARSNMGWSQTGITAGVGAAVTIGKLMQLDATQMRWAIGIAASQAMGFRVSHGTMTTPLMHGQGAETGIRAALLAAKGFTSSDVSIEGKHGYASVYAEQPHLAWLVDDLGERFEVLNLTYKPFPCGIVIHPIIDVCIQLHQQMPGVTPQQLSAIEIEVHPTVLELTGIRHPATQNEAQYSVYHWAAVALAYGTAKISDAETARIADPIVAAVRGRIELKPSSTVPAEGARVVVTLEDGTRRDLQIDSCIGSRARPMTQQAVEDKFRGLAEDTIGRTSSDGVIKLCADIPGLADVGVLAKRAGGMPA